jgi:hypothetical protein
VLLLSKEIYISGQNLNIKAPIWKLKHPILLNHINAKFIRSKVVKTQEHFSIEANLRNKSLPNFSARVINIDPSVCLDGPRPANTCIPLSF